jgi:hypothetical protein
MSKLRSLQEKRDELEAVEAMKTCLQAIVKRHGRMLVTAAELEALRAGNNISLTVTEAGTLLEFVSARPVEEPGPNAG